MTAAGDPLALGFSEAALAPLFSLNALALRAVIEAAGRPAQELRMPLAIQLSPLWLELDPATIDRLSRCPVCLLDAGFSDDVRWTALEDGTLPTRVPTQDVAFARLKAIELSQALFSLAWTWALARPDSARVIFGMTPRVLAAMRALPSALPLADEAWHWVRPRWDGRPAVWRALVRTARQSVRARVPDVGVHAMLQMLADLEPATPANPQTGFGAR